MDAPSPGLGSLTRGTAFARSEDGWKVIWRLRIGVEMCRRASTILLLRQILARKSVLFFGKQ
jgi:hypothetical protein